MPEPSASHPLTALTSPFTQTGRQLADTLRGYRVRTLRADALAGLSVAVLELPQAVAYALIAQVPPQYAIYTSIVQGFLAAVLSSSNHLASGPTNTQSLLVAAAVSQLADPGNGELYLSLVVGMGLIKGLIQLAFAAARMGNLVRYVSQSVIVGFAAGAGVLIAVGQVPAFLGIDVSEQARRFPGVIGEVDAWLPHLGQVNGLALAIGLGALGVVVALRWWSPLAPGALVAVVLSGVAVWLAGWTSAEVPLLGPLPQGLAWPSLPDLSLAHAEQLIGGAFALALLGMIETVSITKVLASRENERVHANQEFFAQGVANAVGAFFQTIPGSGSFTRSALNQMAGGRTRLAGVFASGFVLVVFLLLAEPARYIALPSLAAILMVIAYSLVDWPALRRVARASRSDAVVCLITFLSALLLPLAYAIYVGIFLNIALYLRRASQLHLAEMVQTPGGPFLERPIRDRTGDQKVMFLQLEGDLFFGVADELQDRLSELAHGGLRVVILRLKRTHSIDATVLGVLERFVSQMQAKHGHVVLCGLKPELLEMLRTYGLVAKIGERNVFPASYGVFTSAKQALQRAKELIDGSLDADHIREMDETEGWAFEI